MSTRKPRPLLSIAALSAGTLLSGCGSSQAEDPLPLPGNPKGSHFDDNATAAIIVKGTIEVPEGFQPVGKAVFVSVRGDRPGPPLAAKQLPVGPFPMAFTLTEADRPMVNGPIPESFSVRVAIDTDGNAMTKTPDDLQVVISAKKGAEDVKARLEPIPILRMPGNPKGSMYDKGLGEPVAAPKTPE